MKIKYRFLFYILTSLVFPTLLFAHPHVFIDNIVTIVFDQNGLAGIKAKWYFDEMFSSTITQDFDINKDGKFSDTEVEKIKLEAFSNLKNFNYFSFIEIDGKNFKVKYIKDFSAYLDSSQVVYSFLIPCHVSKDSLYKEIKIAMYDVTYFVQVLLKSENPVLFKNTSNIDFTSKIFEDTSNAYYYRQIFPETILLRFCDKK